MRALRRGPRRIGRRIGRPSGQPGLYLGDGPTFVGSVALDLVPEARVQVEDRVYVAQGRRASVERIPHVLRRDDLHHLATDLGIPPQRWALTGRPRTHLAVRICTIPNGTCGKLMWGARSRPVSYTHLTLP